MNCLRDGSFEMAKKSKKAVLESKHVVEKKSSVMLILLGTKDEVGKKQ